MSVDIKRAFVLGFHYGKKYGLASPREAENYLMRHGYKSACVDAVNAFCNGAEDGVCGDTFRLSL
jgi:hypothetical protein